MSSCWTCSAGAPRGGEDVDGLADEIPKRNRTAQTNPRQKISRIDPRRRNTLFRNVGRCSGSSVTDTGSRLGEGTNVVWGEDTGSAFVRIWSLYWRVCVNRCIAFNVDAISSKHVAGTVYSTNQIQLGQAMLGSSPSQTNFSGFVPNRGLPSPSLTRTLRALGRRGCRNGAGASTSRPATRPSWAGARVDCGERGIFQT